MRKKVHTRLLGVIKLMQLKIGNATKDPQQSAWAFLSSYSHNVSLKNSFLCSRLEHTNVRIKQGVSNASEDKYKKPD